MMPALCTAWSSAPMAACSTRVRAGVSWESVLRRLLEDRDDYERVARASQEAAQGFVESLGIARFERYFERLLAASPSAA